MRVSVLTPWIDIDCYWRQRAKQWTYGFWRNLWIEVIYGSAESVNRAAARNDAARRTDADVLFFADADMWVPAEQFSQAVELAASSGQMVLAYESHLRLNKASSTQVIDGQESKMQGQRVRDCIGGAFAVNRDLYELVGGHDERFTTWGGEDRSFYFACRTLAGVERIEGTSFHLWHPRDPTITQHTPARTAGVRLGSRYKKAAGVKRRSGMFAATADAETDPDEMRAILREPGGPLSQAVAPDFVRYFDRLQTLRGEGWYA